MPFFPAMSVLVAAVSRMFRLELPLQGRMLLILILLLELSSLTTFAHPFDSWLHSQAEELDSHRHATSTNTLEPPDAIQRPTSRVGPFNVADALRGPGLETWRMGKQWRLGPDASESSSSIQPQSPDLSSRLVSCRHSSPVAAHRFVDSALVTPSGTRDLMDIATAVGVLERYVKAAQPSTIRRPSSEPKVFWSTRENKPVHFPTQTSTLVIAPISAIQIYQSRLQFHAFGFFPLSRHIPTATSDPDLTISLEFSTSTQACLLISAGNSFVARGLQNRFAFIFNTRTSILSFQFLGCPVSPRETTFSNLRPWSVIIISVNETLDRYVTQPGFHLMNRLKKIRRITGALLHVNNRNSASLFIEPSYVRGRCRRCRTSEAVSGAVDIAKLLLASLEYHRNKELTEIRPPIGFYAENIRARNAAIIRNCLAGPASESLLLSLCNVIYVSIADRILYIHLKDTSILHCFGACYPAACLRKVSRPFRIVFPASNAVNSDLPGARN